MRKVTLMIFLCLFLIGCNSSKGNESKIELPVDSPKINEVFYKVEDKIGNNGEFNKGSKIDEISLTDNNIDNLYLLGKVWGFLKYYHPYVAKGEYNWDYELFRVLPRIIEVENTDERDEMLCNWIESLGDYEAGRYPLENEWDIKVNIDLNWIENSNLKQGLILQLTDIKKARRRLNSKYADVSKYMINPDFKNEKPYSQMTYPDAGYRLLSLYRYWNIIEYYFPYKYLIEEDWNNVLKEFIPKFLDASDELEYNLVVLELITRINDSHAVVEKSKILDQYWGINYSPIKVAFIEDKLVVIDYYNKELVQQSGLKIGDIITNINNKTVEDIVIEMEPYVPASNHPTKLRNISRDILRTNEESLRIDYISNDEINWTEVKCYPKEVLNSDISEFNRLVKNNNADTYYKVIDSDIGYIYPGLFKAEYEKELLANIKDTKGLIIDFRSYPMEPIMPVLGNYLFPESIQFAKFTKGSLEEPGSFSFQHNSEIGMTNDYYYKGKIVIIINEISQSQSEFTTMAFRKAPNAIVIGSNSAGADGDVSFFYLPGNIYTRITAAGVYYPDGGETQRIGIIPDIEVNPTIEGIKAGRDELIEKAIQIIKEDER
ncbi:S41 family peptidase [Tissierella sp.]|uniref:S41 family peptidase n=1 Tax=Tissierella sp. TaxID=41274 RepID=UPI002863C6CC|nr:S41 family peptidase [Tissierella sp.]MDR7857739.1 S41 family peptidase [Tissierella sp.]